MTASFFDNAFWQYELYGNTIEAYGLALLFFLVGLVLLKGVQFVVIKRLEKLVRKSDNDVDDALIEMVRTIKPPFYWFISFYIATRYVELSGLADKVLGWILVIWVTYQVISALQIFIQYFAERKLDGDDPSKKSMQALVRTFSVIILWSLGLLFVLSNFGVDITSLIAGLGIGGIAIALAAQNVLSDLFSSLAIFFDKPFVPGDFIVVGQDSGTVKDIGIKTTRLKSLDGEEVVIPNKDLTEARIQNYRTMTERRVLFNFGVLYETPQAKMKKIPEIVEQVISSVDQLRFGRVHFNELGDSALIYEVVYHVETKEYSVYMDGHQEVLLGLKGAFEKEGIEMAYPTQTIYTKQG